MKPFWKRVVESEFGTRDLSEFPADIQEAVRAAPTRKDGRFDRRYAAATSAQEALGRAFVIMQEDYANA